MKTKKLFALLLAVVMVFSLSVTAFAAWNQFQKDAAHSGLISSAGVPTSTPSLLQGVTLTHADSWTADSGLPGVDCASVVVGNTAYVVYYGGPAGEENGGIRVSGVSLSDTPTEVWSTQLLADAEQEAMATDNIQQLSTPYYDDGRQTLYAPVTYTKNIFEGKTVTTRGGASYNTTTGKLSLTGNVTGTVIISDVTVDGDTLLTYIGTGLKVPNGKSLSGNVQFRNTTTGTSYYFGNNVAYAGYEFCLYNNSNTSIPAGSYQVTITLNSNVNCGNTSQPLRAVTPYWRLFSIRVFEHTAARFGQPAQITDGSYVEGAGQINTPVTGVTYNGHKYLYFGVYDGERAYYQYRFTSTPETTLKKFVPADSSNTGFYWAGAAVVGGNVVFGAENGHIYSRPIGDNFGSTSSNVGGDLDLHLKKSDVGAVRSSICYDNGYLYFTTKDAVLWKVPSNLNKDDTKYAVLGTTTDPLVRNASSTPVVSPSGYVYVGGYNINWDDGFGAYKGALKAIHIDNFANSSSNVKTLWSATSNGAVQSSPVVFYDEGDEVDYVYFTTNGAAGQARCVAFNVSDGAVSGGWQTNSGTYTLQGFAVSDNGYMTFGNDNNIVFVMK